MNTLSYNQINSSHLKLRTRLNGLKVHRKLSYPARYGCYHELIMPDGIYHMALDGFPKFFQGVSKNWPHPQEWLKLSRNGDWVYYSTQGYSDIFDLTGEYYYPLLPYPSNPVFPVSQQQSREISAALADHDKRCALAGNLSVSCGNREEAAVLSRFSRWTGEAISSHARRFHRIIKARIPVLPPDCRHVDYDVLPLMLTEGCLANCGFCRIKTSGEFRLRSTRDVREQLAGLRELLGEELGNYRGVFLGQHDCLAAGCKPILAALGLVTELMTLQRKYVHDPVVFLFGSTRSLSALKDDDLKLLDRLPFQIYINIGLESFDQETLDILKKPVRAEENRSVFRRILDINRQFTRIRISANLVLGDLVGPGHLSGIVDVLRNVTVTNQPETIIYLSPLHGFYQTKNILYELRYIKSHVRLPVYPYLIHRL